MGPHKKSRWYGRIVKELKGELPPGKLQDIGVSIDKGLEGDYLGLVETIDLHPGESVMAGKRKFFSPHGHRTLHNIRFSQSALKGPHRRLVVKHEVGHILEDPKQVGLYASPQFMERGEYERAAERELSATVAGYGGTHRFPAYYLEWETRVLHNDTDLSLRESWEVVKKVARKLGIPFSKIKKAEREMKDEF